MSAAPGCFPGTAPAQDILTHFFAKWDFLCPPVPVSPQPLGSHRQKNSVLPPPPSIWILHPHLGSLLKLKLLTYTHTKINYETPNNPPDGSKTGEGLRDKGSLVVCPEGQQGEWEAERRFLMTT